MPKPPPSSEAKDAKPLEIDVTPFARFARATGNGRVTRYGTGTTIDPTVVVALTHEEWASYSREYGRAVREGALELVEAADYIAFASGHRAAEEAEVRRREEEAKKAEEAAKKKKAAEATPPQE